MKKIVVLLCALCLSGIIAAGELSVKEWEKFNSDIAAYMTSQAELVAAGQADPIKCATPVFLGLQNSRPQNMALSPAYPGRETFLTKSYGTAHFLIHYIDTGASAPYQYSAQDSVSGVPNYIFEAGKICEEVYTKYIGMGYNPPPSDGAQTNNGGDGRYDIYVINFGAYGATVRDQLVTSTTATSYLFIENDYEGFGYTNRIYPLQVAIAHEYFHSIQFGYDIAEVEATPYPGDVNASWMEMSAVYMEELHYDNVNDYLGYLPYFYDFPHWSLKFGTYRGDPGRLSNRNYHMYGSVVWPLFLVQQFDSSVIKEVWDSCRVVPGPNWVPATNSIIKRRTSGADSLATMFTEFTLWNFFTGSRSRTGEYFEEAINFDRALIADTVYSYPGTVQVHDTLQPDNLGANYIMLNNVSSLTEGLRITFNAANGYKWALQVVGLPVDVQNGTVWVDPTIYTQDNQFIPVPSAASFNKIILIPAVLNSNDSAVNYSLVLSPLGEGVFLPAGGENWYAGETHSISWALPDSTLAIDIEYSIDSGATWTNITRVANLTYVYNWVVPETPSNKCFVRIVDAENSAIADTSGMFSILVAGGNQVMDPYPSPAWMHMTDNVTFKAVISPNETSGDQNMKITILNLVGEKVNDLLPVAYGTGEVSVAWDFTNNAGEKVAAGPYLAVIEIGGESFVKKFMVLR